MNRIFFFTSFLFLFSLICCTPKIYIIDRQTVLQEEAAGEWPDFESSLIQSVKKKNPTSIPNRPNNDSENMDQLYKMLNSDFGEN